MLTEKEFEYLLGVPKILKEDDELVLGPPPLKWTREIEAKNSKETFLLDYRKGSFEFKKYTFNSRYRNSIILFRYDSLGKHTNPPGTDEKSFDGAHVHIYREGFDDKWAFPITEIGLNETEEHDITDVLKKLLEYFHVENIPSMRNSLF